MKTNHLLPQALVACSLSSFAIPAAADAADVWIAYRQANGLSVDPQPSRPEDQPTFVGPVPEAPGKPLDAERDILIARANGSGNGNGNGDYVWPSQCGGFFVELARSDGDTLGGTARCK